MKVHLSLAAYPRFSPIEAMRRATHEHVSEPLLGRLSLDHVQVCPQNTGVLDDEYITGLVQAYPNTQFRLHANARVEYKRQVVDLAQFDPTSSFWKALRSTSELLGAPAYTAHAGLKANASLAEVFDNTRRAQDFMGIPVGIEGHYPTPRGIYLIDSWLEYAMLWKSGVNYALDLSHLHILARQTDTYPSDLIKQMLSSPNCIEVHVSTNDGRRDSHQLLETEPWWWPLLPHAHPNAIIFSEGTQP